MRTLMRHPVTVVIAVLVLVAAGFAAWSTFMSPSKTITAKFVRAIGVNAGSDVRVLGVKVGEIGEVKPSGKTVTVKLHIDTDIDVPDKAKAVVIPPSVVADRYIELTPAYKGGKTMNEGATLGTNRTVVPMELDEVYNSLDEFSEALGKDGSLADAIATAKKNLDGNGGKLGESLDKLADVSDVLNDNSDDLWTTVDNLSEFTEALASSDAEMEVFNEKLADVSTQLSDERGNLSEALEQLTVALGDVQGFVKDNADQLTGSVDKLTDLSGVLARQQKAIIEILDYAPVALTNLDMTYNSHSGTLDTRDDLLGAHDPASFLCSQLASAVALDEIPKSCFDLAEALTANGADVPKELQKLVGKGGEAGRIE